MIDENLGKDQFGLRKNIEQLETRGAIIKLKMLIENQTRKNSDIFFDLEKAFDNIQ